MINAHSERAREALPHVQDGLRSRGLRVRELHVARDHKELARLVRGAAKAGARAIAVGGGDGTMARAVNAAAHTRSTLGIIPLGTGNSFAQSLGLDAHDLDGALDVIAQGRTERIDLGCVNGTHFANFATIGLSSEIAGATSRTEKNVFGRLAYAIAAIVPLARHRAFRARIDWGGGRLDVRTLDVVVANGRFFGAYPLAPDATLDDARLTLFTRDDASRTGALRTYLAMGMHAQNRLPNAHTVNAGEFTVRTRRKQRIAIDGTLYEKTPARFRIARRALRVYVPAAGIAR